MIRFYSTYQFDSPSKRITGQQPELNAQFQRRLAFILWSLFGLFWSYCFIAYIQVKLYVLIVCLFNIIMEIFTNGVIDYVCQLNANSRDKQN